MILSDLEQKWINHFKETYTSRQELQKKVGGDKYIRFKYLIDIAFPSKVMYYTYETFWIKVKSFSSYSDLRKEWSNCKSTATVLNIDYKEIYKYFNYSNSNNKNKSINSKLSFQRYIVENNICSRTDLSKHSYSLYRKAQKYNWIDLIKSQKGQKTYIQCKNDALKYHKKFDWQKNDSATYQCARKNKWLKELTTHMYSGVGVYWDEDRILNSCRNYVRYVDWSRENSWARHNATKLGILDVVKQLLETGLPSQYIKNVATGKFFNSKNMKNIKRIKDSIRLNQRSGGYYWAYCDSEGNILDIKKKK